jgi:DNA polymerase IV (DinB-like DNA polymerase)
MGLETIQDLKKLDVFTLNKEFGRKNGAYIYNAVRGMYNEPVKEREASIQYSKISTLKKDSKEYQFLSESIIDLCKEVHSILLKNNRMFKSVGIHLIQSDLSSKSRSRMLKNPTSSLEELQKNADQLLREALENQTITIRRLGVKVTELSEVQGQSSITNYF